MFRLNSQQVGRVSFASKLFPKFRSPIGLDTSKFDNEPSSKPSSAMFAGRSKNKHLLSYFGFIHNLAGSSFVQLPSFRRSLSKLTRLVHTELQLAVDSQEILLPTLVPQKLWHQSERLERQHNALDHVYSLQDHAGTPFLLGPTFEETVTQLMADIEQITDFDLPIVIHQTSPKFRLEPNPKFGLVRCNEFFMNDAYSFDADLKRATQTYERISDAYEKIFKKLSLDCVRIEGGTGNIGGRFSHEYQLGVMSGEDSIIKCLSCGKAYNSEMVTSKSIYTQNSCVGCNSNQLQTSQALELGHTFLLSDTYSKPLKARFTAANGQRLNFEMGCYGLGLTRIIAAGVDLFSHVTEEDVVQLRWPSAIEPYKLGIIAPARRSKQFEAGSTLFIEKLVQRLCTNLPNLDIMVEDRDKESLVKRLIGLKSMGVPNIVVIGSKFTQEVPEFEVHRLNGDKRNYQQSWQTETQLYDYLEKLDTN